MTLDAITIGGTALFTGLLTWGGLNHIEVSQLRADNKDLRLELATAQSSFNNCDRALTQTNDLILSNAIDYQDRLDSVEIVYVDKIIPEYITLDKGDCNETSNILDFIRVNHP